MGEFIYQLPEESIVACLDDAAARFTPDAAFQGSFHRKLPDRAA